MVAPIIIIWALIWISICLNYIKPLSQLSFWDQLLVFIILAIAAPALFLAEIVDALLDLIMPPGWDDDNNFAL